MIQSRSKYSKSSFYLLHKQDIQLTGVLLNDQKRKINVRQRILKFVVVLVSCCTNFSSYSLLLSGSYPKTYIFGFRIIILEKRFWSFESSSILFCFASQVCLFPFFFVCSSLFTYYQFPTYDDHDEQLNPIRFSNEPRSRS